MREDPIEPTFELQDWFDGGDIFLRPKDKKRLREAVAAIVENDLGIAVIGSNEVILDHYYRMLVARVRQHERFELEMFLPVTTDSLLSRFNDMLAEISMEQAAAPPAADQPVRLLVINDARMIDNEQWGLLARLLSDFPGVNVRLALVINKSGWPAHENLLNTLGRRLHRWVVEAPVIGEARELLDAADENGYLRDTEALLVDAGLGTVVASRKRSLEEPEDGDLAKLPELDMDVLMGAADDKSLAVSDDHSTSNKRRIWPALILAAVAVAMTLLIISRLYPEYFDADTAAQAEQQGLSTESMSEETRAYRVESIPVPTDAQSGAALQADAEPQNNDTSPVEMQSPQVADQGNSQLEEDSLSGQADEVDDASMEAQQPDSAVEKIAQSVAPQMVPPTSPPVAAASNIVDSIVDIIAAAPPSNYFIQHIVLSSEAAANVYIERYQALSDAAVVPVRLAQKSAWAVISGPFNSRPAAASFTAEPGVPEDFWIRDAAQLQAILRP